MGAATEKLREPKHHGQQIRVR